MNKTLCVIAWLCCSSAGWAGEIPVLASLVPATALAELAESDDLVSYDPNSLANQDLLNRGLGFPVAVRPGNDSAVLVASPSTGLELEVPRGWRGFDDGEKTRLFAPDGKVGLVLGMVSNHPRDFIEYRKQQSTQIARMMEQSGEYRPVFVNTLDAFGLIERNVMDSGESYSSIVVYVDHPKRNDMKIRINLFSPVERFNLLAGLVTSTVENLRSQRTVN